MKKLMFVLLAGLIVSQFASATSIRNVRLMYREVPVVSPIPAQQLTSVVVYGDGDVMKFVCDSFTPRECDTQILGRFTAHQIDRIDRLIDRARHGKLVRIGGVAMCLVAPSTEDQYTADNGQVFLKQGHMCTLFTENSSLAAKRLVRILANLRDGNLFVE
ncbi:MAG: hypothetical protein HY537_08650 [Deltaproteobacteria bacterium]|nr:hypothetical protein [Deltaproteobacteria bacterium]